MARERPLSGRRLARVVEGAEVALAYERVVAWEQIAGQANSGTLAIGSGVASFLTSESPFSLATGVGLDGAIEEDAVDRLLRFYRRRRAPAAIDVCPLAHPSLVMGLYEAGFRVRLFRQVMTARLDLELALSLSRPPGVREVGRAGARMWTGLMSRAWARGRAVSDEQLEMFQILFGVEGAVSLVALEERSPVGGASVFLFDKHAVLGVPAALGRAPGGTLRRLLQGELHLAVEEACESVSLSVPPGSRAERVAAELGLEVAYTRALMVKED